MTEDASVAPDETATPPVLPDDGWMLQQVSDGSDEERYPIGKVAVGDVALVGWPDGSFTRVVAS